MADITRLGPGCDDDCGERGERGKRGRRGHDGDTGATGPTGPAGGGSSGLLQTVSADVTTDVTVGGISAILLSVPIVIGAGSTLLVFFSAAAENTGANRTRFILEVDGLASSPPKGAEITHPGVTPNVLCACIDVRLTGLAPGAHTITIRWVASAGTSLIAGATGNLVEHGTLIVEEVNV